jgi:Protein of unknown function (DUF2911)
MLRTIGAFSRYISKLNSLKPNTMKKLLALSLLLMAFVSVESLAQDKKPASPKEIVEGSIDGAKVTIVYHRPSVKGRKVMGELVPFGQVWRTGANDATTITFDKAVIIEGKSLAAGTYSLFTVPTENEWTIIFNSEAKQWGAYKYNDKNDVLRVSVKPAKVDFTELFTISIDKNSVNIAWENTSASFSVKKG